MLCQKEKDKKKVQLGKYNLIRKKIGKGSFSKIYKALDKNDKEVAVKIIKKKNVKNEKLIQREISVLQSLKHINIISLLDVFTTNHNYYLIFEFCEYGDLKNYIYKENPILDEQDILFIMKQIKNGLEYLYNENIIHRDLKPQNILVTDNLIIKISDFGFAKIYTEGSLTQTICGSPLYMAPEILTYKQYTELADLWSVGVILYEIMFKEVPVSGSNLYTLVKNINQYQFKITKKQKIKYSANIINLLERLLIKNPKKRIDWKSFFNHQWFYKSNEIDFKKELNEDLMFVMDEDTNVNNDSDDDNYSVIMSSKNSVMINNNYLDSYLSIDDEEDDNNNGNFIIVKKKNISTIPRSMPKNRFTDMLDSLRSSLSNFFTSPNSI